MTAHIVKPLSMKPDGLWCKRWRSSQSGAGSRSRLSGKNRIPDLRCGFVFDAKLAEYELTLSDPVHEFDAGDRRYGSTEMLEAEHRTKPQLDRTGILFNQIVDVFGRPGLPSIFPRLFV